MILLIVFDLSTAYRVIDHPLLLKRSEYSVGMKEDALTYVKSYLAGGTQCVSVTNKT